MSKRFQETASGEPTSPDRLRVADGTPLERRLLDAVAHERPPRALLERMALGIGVSPPAPPTVVGPGSADLGAGVSKSALAGRALPWLSATAVVAVVGAIVATRPATAPVTVRSAPAPGSAPAQIAPPTIASATPHMTAIELPSNRPPAPAPASPAPLSDIQDQIALVDSARGALAAGGSNRALELLRTYQRKYPGGSFRPEVAALKIEALQKLGRTTEARALAERFIAENRGSPLADRVARMTRSEKP